MTRLRSPRRRQAYALIPLFIILRLSSCVQQVSGAATAKAERALYEPEDGTTPTAKFADYHALVDWYYAETAAGRKPDGRALRDEIRQTMVHRLSQPQRYYGGTGYVPGEDEGWRPDGVDWETYKLYREKRNEAARQRDQEELPIQAERDKETRRNR